MLFSPNLKPTETQLYLVRDECQSTFPFIKNSKTSILWGELVELLSETLGKHTDS